MMAKWHTGREGEEGHIEWRSPGLISTFNVLGVSSYYLADRQSYRKRCTTVCLDSLCRRRVPICPAQLLGAWQIGNEAAAAARCT